MVFHTNFDEIMLFRLLLFLKKYSWSLKQVALVLLSLLILSFVIFISKIYSIFAFNCII